MIQKAALDYVVKTVQVGNKAFHGQGIDVALLPVLNDLGKEAYDVVQIIMHEHSDSVTIVAKRPQSVAVTDRRE